MFHLALQSLREYYTDLEQHGIYSPNEAEFQAYYLLSHLYQNEFLSKAEQLRPEVLNHPLVQLSIEFTSIIQNNNCTLRGHPRTEGSLNAFYRFFKKLQSQNVPYLFGCLLHMSFITVRRGALKAMQGTYYCFPDQEAFVYPVSHLVQILALNDEAEAREYFEYFEIPVSPDGRVAYIGKMKDAFGKVKSGNFKG